MIIKKEDAPKVGGHFLPTKVEDILIGSLNLNEGVSCRRVEISTDYFGGGGEQWAMFHDADGSKVEFQDEVAGGAINSALAMLGIDQADGMDLFDTVGIGAFRSEYDLDPNFGNVNGSKQYDGDALEISSIERDTIINVLNKVKNGNVEEVDIDVALGILQA